MKLLQNKNIYRHRSKILSNRARIGAKKKKKIAVEGFNSLLNVKTKEHFLFMEYLLHDENKIIKVYTDFRLLD